MNTAGRILIQNIQNRRNEGEDGDQVILARDIPCPLQTAADQIATQNNRKSDFACIILVA